MPCSSLSDRSVVAGASEREAERRMRRAFLDAKIAVLRTRMVTAKGEYEAGRLSLAEELRLIRHIERTLMAIETQMHDLARDEPPSMPHIPR